MQTFLPYPDFLRSLQCLDYRRLGKQRVESRQILDILLNKKEGAAWSNHPATLMWRGYESALITYYNFSLEEWSNRGFKNRLCKPLEPSKVEFPPWFGLDEFHASHRSNLLRKNAEFYSKFGWSEPNDLPYVWPVRLCVKKDY